MFTYLAPMKRYTKSEAPKSFGKLVENPMFGGAISGDLVLALLADDPYKSLMNGVTKSKDLGVATFDGRPAAHLGFEQKEFDWEVWIATGAEPLLLQATVDLAKSMKQATAKAGGAGGESGGGGRPMKLVLTRHYRNWRINSKPSAGSFVFTPPKDAKQAESLFGHEDEEEEVSPLLGKPAPSVDLKQLDGKPFKLSDRAGKSVVMLDMWATWCGPCRAEMPLLAELAQDYKSKGVELFAVNQRESKEKIDKFLKKEKIEIPILLDEEGKVGDAYGAESIPLLVLVDKKGIVQSVHMGFDPNMKEQVAKELDGILAGKNLAEAEIAKRKTAASKERLSAVSGGLDRRWSANGRYTSAVYDPQTKMTFALRSGGQCDVLGSDGKVRRSFKIETDGTTLRLARLTDAKSTDLLAFGSWTQSVVAFKSDGAVLWRENNSTGIDDVWAVDLDGDGRTEVALGYNGGTGLHVLDPQGHNRWKTTEIGNVWHVAAGDVNGDGKAEVISTSAAGMVHVFDARGKSVANLEAPFYATGIQAIRISTDDRADTIVITGSSSRNAESMAALDGKGRVLWKLLLSDRRNNVESLAVCPARPWAACSLSSGRVAVIDCAKGKQIASIDSRSRRLQVAWASSDEGQVPLLLVADGQALTAYEVKPISSEAAAKKEPEKSPHAGR